MSYRPHGHAAVDPRSPRAWATCDRCGGNYNLENLAFQFDYRGQTLQNTNLMVCDRCEDVPQPQLKPLVLPPDPIPVQNARPEPYTMNETDYRITEEDDRRITEEDDLRITEDGDY